MVCISADGDDEVGYHTAGITYHKLIQTQYHSHWVTIYPLRVVG